MMNFLARTVIACLCLLSFSEASGGLEILVPESRVCISRGKITIIGKTDAAIIDIFVDERDYASVIVTDGIFHQQVEFGFGLHEIKIVPVYSGRSSSRTDSATVEVIFAPKINREFKILYPDYVFHSQKIDSACTPCHDVDLRNADKAEHTKTCLSCHISLKESFTKHTEGEDETCFLCHKLDSDLLPVIDERTISKNPCFNCHPDKIDFYDKEYVHGPVAGGSCLICHASHGSKNEHMLRLPEDQLCFECHEDVEKQVKATVVHQPFMEGDCGGCHDPHSTNNEWILKTKSESVCLSCHDPEGDLKNHSHPFDVAPKNDLPDHLKLTTKGQLECLTCHEAHSSNQPFMLKTESIHICLDCHEDL